MRRFLLKGKHGFRTVCQISLVKMYIIDDRDCMSFISIDARFAYTIKGTYQYSNFQKFYIGSFAVLYLYEIGHYHLCCRLIKA